MLIYSHWLILEGGVMMEKWLMAIRTKQKLTQKECAQKANIAQAYYCQIENGERTPSVDTAKSIAKVLGFKWTKFFEDKK